MPRTSKPRRVGAMPRCCRFGAEAARRDNFHIAMTVEEYETIRLIDYLGKTQEECASLMNVGRGTVQMLYAEARKKLARFLVEGCRLEIGGGDFVLDGAGRGGCPGKGGGCRAADAAEPVRPYEKKGDDLMVIAVTYDNGEVFQHFGHTEQFKLYQVENGRVAASKVVDTADSGHGALAGFLKENGVDVLICGGIGGGARNALANAGIQLFGGACGNADAQVESYLAGTLAYDPDVQCSHHGHGHEGGECHGHGNGHEGGECHSHGNGHDGGECHGHGGGGCHSHGDGSCGEPESH